MIVGSTASVLVTLGACVDEMAPSEDTNANTATNTTSNRQRDGQPARTPKLRTTNPFHLSPGPAA